MKGAGEHMPTELENAMSGYEELPKGYTIGPVDNLATLPKAEHIKYVHDLLPQLSKLGWITDNARQWYEKNLKSTDLQAVRKHAEQDLKSEQITSEVFAMLQAIKQ